MAATNNENKDEESIFNAALELDNPAERTAYLRKACRNDRDLLNRVQVLLELNEIEDSFLEEPPTICDMPTGGQVTAEIPGTVIDRYKLLEKIGEGGFGEVWAAEQKKPVKRRVALKIIKLGMDTKQVVARFEAERQALALMDHPNIAKVLDAGATETGRPYFVMELVRGIPIIEYCDQAKLSTKNRLNLFIKVCNAIQHAHQKGIIHRDIKPSNILITLHDGIPVPRIIDFGIAKATQQELTEMTIYTRHDQFIGTPAYMSPEQAEMSGLDIDTRSDIYSLGVLLYELLTGKTPFDEKELMKSGVDQMRKIIREQDPPKPSTKFATLEIEEQSTTATRHSTDSPRLISLLRGDLDWIVMKCLEKDRTRRYETANGLAMDVTRYLKNEPVIARPPTVFYQLQKAWRRNKVIYTATFMVVVSLILGISLSVWQAIEATRAKKQAIANEILAQQNFQLAKQRATEARESEINALRRAYNSDMSLAYQALEENLFSHVQETVRQHVPKPGYPDFRGWEWRYAWAECQSDAALIWETPAEMGRVSAVRLSPDQRYMVTSGFRTGAAFWPLIRRLWNFQTREELKHVHLPSGSARGFAFSNLGKFLALHRDNGNDTHEIQVYDTDTWKLETTIPSETSIASLSFSPDDKTLAIFAYSKAILLDWRRNTTVYHWPVQSSWLDRHDIAFFPDGRKLAIGGADELKIVDVASGLILHQQPARDVDTRLAISPDSRYVAIGSGFEISEIGLLNADLWEQEPPLKGHSAWVTSLTFTPDGKRLISASVDQTLRVWDMQRRVTTRVLRGHQSVVNFFSVTSDGARAVSVGQDKRILEWDLNAPLSPYREHLLAEPAWQVVFSADSRFCYTTDKNGSVNVWDTNTFSKQHSLSQELGLGSRIILSPEGDHLIAGTKSGDLWVLNAGDLQVVEHRNILSGQILPVGFSADGKFLVVLEYGNRISQWNIDTWQLKSRVETELDFKYLEKGRYAIPSGSDMLLCSVGDTDLVWWDLAQSKELKRVRLDSRGFDNHITASPTQPLLASIAAGDFIRLWDWKTRQDAGEVHGPRDFSCIAFSPDGRRLVSGSSGKGTLRLWDVSTWQEIARLGTDTALTLGSVQFSPDGNIICAIYKGQKAYFLRAPSFEEIKAIEARQLSKERR